MRVETVVAVMAMFVASLTTLAGCATPRTTMGLDRVVLYRNGIGYFERTGTVEGQELRLRCRKDQVDDVLKSLTVVDRSDGKALSVSMPLDPQSWANAAMAMLAPGQGSLSDVFQSLKGTRVTLVTADRTVSGRILMVDTVPSTRGGVLVPEERISLLDDGLVEVALLSEVVSVEFADAELTLQLHRSLDASAGEGMFQQVDVVVRLSEQTEHDVMLSYVVAAPIWKPTYRVVLPDDNKGAALLQGWAVVDNTSGEDWDAVHLSLTSGAPIAFQYDLHTPKTITRQDMSGAGHAKSARVAIGEATLAAPDKDKVDDLLAEGMGLSGVGRGGGGSLGMLGGRGGLDTGGGRGYGRGAPSRDAVPRVEMATPQVMGSLDKSIIKRVIRRHRSELSYCYERELAADPTLAGTLVTRFTVDASGAVSAATTQSSTLGSAAVERCVNRAIGRWRFPAPKGGGIVVVNYPFAFQPSDDAGVATEKDADGESNGFDMSQLAASAVARTEARQVAGLTQFELDDRVTVPGGSSTMVAIVNEPVEAEQAFLFRPGGSGAGYEHNPYRVVRFKNSTPFVLEPGPISIYSGGSFVGEGISETIAAGSSTTVPFAVEPSIVITSTTQDSSGERRLVKVQRGVLTVESYQHHTTTWKIKGARRSEPYRVLIRQPRRGRRFELQSPPEGTEELPDAYLVPVDVPAGSPSASLSLVERTPSRTTLSIWDRTTPSVLTAYLGASDLSKEAVGKLRPIVEAREAIASIDLKISNLKIRQRELDQRADQIRMNLEAIKKDRAAGGLRARLNKKLEGFTKEGDKLGRTVVELTTKRLEKKIELDEALDGFTFEAPTR